MSTQPTRRPTRSSTVAEPQRLPSTSPPGIWSALTPSQRRGLAQRLARLIQRYRLATTAVTTEKPDDD